MAKLDTQLHEIADMSRTNLQHRWTKLTVHPVPRLSVSMLRLTLAYEIQAKAMGRLSRKGSQQLAEAREARSRAMPLAPGTRAIGALLCTWTTNAPHPLV